MNLNISFKVHEKHIIPRVKGLNNTFQFLYSYHYRDKVKFFEDNFDFIIFDTGPILSRFFTTDRNAISTSLLRHAINRITK